MDRGKNSKYIKSRNAVLKSKAWTVYFQKKKCFNPKKSSRLLSRSDYVLETNKKKKKWFFFVKSINIILQIIISKLLRTRSFVNRFNYFRTHCSNYAWHNFLTKTDQWMNLRIIVRKCKLLSRRNRRKTRNTYKKKKKIVPSNVVRDDTRKFSLCFKMPIILRVYFFSFNGHSITQCRFVQSRFHGTKRNNTDYYN